MSIGSTRSKPSHSFRYETGDNIPDPKPGEVVLDEIEIDLGLDDDEPSSEPAPPKTTADQDDLSALSSKDLTERCRALGLPVSGNKNAKLQRLQEATRTETIDDEFEVDLGPDLETLTGDHDETIAQAVAASMKPEVDEETQEAVETQETQEAVETQETQEAVETQETQEGVETQEGEEAPETPQLTIDDLDPIDTADDLDFSSVGIPTWKVKVKIGLTYDFSDIRTLHKYIHDGRVTNEDTISYDAGSTWKTLGDIPDLEAYFIEVFQVAKLARMQERPDNTHTVGDAESQDDQGMAALGADLAQEALRQITEEIPLDDPTEYTDPIGPSFEDPFQKLKDRRSEVGVQRREQHRARDQRAHDRKILSQRRVLFLSALFISASFVFWTKTGLEDEKMLESTPPNEAAQSANQTTKPSSDLREQIRSQLETVNDELPLEEFLESEVPQQRIAVRPQNTPEGAPNPAGQPTERQLTTVRSASEYAKAGEEAMQNGNFGLAAEEFKKAISANAGQARWRASYGKCLYRMERYAEARDEMAMAERAGVADRELLTMLVDSFNRLGDPAGASTYRQKLER